MFMDDESRTVDELTWADSEQAGRNREDFFHFLIGRTKRPEWRYRRPRRISKKLKTTGTSLFLAFALIASVLALGEVANNSAEALLADGSCPGGGIIEPGETVSEIAERYGVNASRIIELNGIVDADYIRSGDCLDLGLQTACNGHIVENGDTVTQLALRYDTTIDTLVDINGLKSADQIFVRQCLLLADTGTADVLPNAVSVAPQDPEETAEPEVREVVDEIVEDFDTFEEIFEEVVTEEVVAVIVEEVPQDTVVAEDDIMIEVQEVIEVEVADRIQEEIKEDIGEDLEEQKDIDAALDYLNVLSVPDPGPVSMDQAWEWYRNGNGPTMEITDVARLLRWAGFCTYGVEELVLAVSTVGGESAFRPYVLGDVNIQYQGDVSVGLGQIYWSPGNDFTSDNRNPERNINPRENVQTMFGMYEWRIAHDDWKDRFDDWYGHDNGVRQHGNAARQAVSNIGGCE